MRARSARSPRAQIQLFFRQAFDRLARLGRRNRQAQESLLFEQQREGGAKVLASTFTACAVPKQATAGVDLLRDAGDHGQALFRGFEKADAKQVVAEIDLFLRIDLPLSALLDQLFSFGAQQFAGIEKVELRQAISKRQLVCGLRFNSGSLGRHSILRRHDAILGEEVCRSWRGERVIPEQTLILASGPCRLNHPRDQLPSLRLSCGLPPSDQKKLVE